MTLDEGGWRRPNVLAVTPPAVLEDVVEFLWLDEWSAESASARPFRVVADDAAHILWYLNGDHVLRTDRIAVAGARDRHCDVNLSGRQLLVGARLVPGAIPALFGIPASALTNQSVSLGQMGVRGVNRIATRDSVLDDLSSLIEGMRRRRVVDSRAAWIAGQERCGTTSVGSFARLFEMPPRSVRAWSTRTVGMGLKRLLKIRRLHAALEFRLSGAHETWGQIAAAAGYADQSHLVRDCRGLLGESPSEFVSRGTCGTTDSRTTELQKTNSHAEARRSRRTA